MKGLINLTVAAAAATLAAFGSAAPGGAAEPRIIVVRHGQANGPFWSVVKKASSKGRRT